MFAALRTALSKPLHTRDEDPLTAATSLAAQENQAASDRLKSVMCKLLEGDNCKCLKISTAFKQ